VTVHVHCLAELRSTFRATFCALFVAAVAGALLPASVEAQTYEVLHGFSVEGGSPRGALLLAADGSLYGTTESGGRFAIPRRPAVGWVEQAEDRVGLRSLATPGSRTDCHCTIRRLVTPTLGLSLA